MPDVATAADQIKRAPAPVLFLDTCVLLDIVRAPLRDAATSVEAATELLTGATRKPPTVYLVIACPTPTEWLAHIDEAMQDCENAVKSVSAVSAVCGYVGLGVLDAIPADLPTLPDKLRELSKNLLNASILLDKEGLRSPVPSIDLLTVVNPREKGGKGPRTP